MIRVTDTISIDESELSESFVRSSGPGGQNVNKLSTAVQLRFDVRHSPSLPNDVAVRLIRLAGRRLTKDGVLVITAQRHRTQERNRADARERLIEMIREAATPPVPRRPTRPPAGSRRERLRVEKAPLRHQAAAASETVIRIAGAVRALPSPLPHYADKFRIIFPLPALRGEGGEDLKGPSRVRGRAMPLTRPRFARVADASRRRS